MELNERQIIDASTCSIGHGQTVSCSNTWVGGLLPKPTHTSRCENHSIRLEGNHLLGLLIEAPNTSNPFRGCSVLALDEVNGEGVWSQMNSFVPLSIGGECSLNLSSSGIFRMENALR